MKLGRTISFWLVFLFSISLNAQVGQHTWADSLLNLLEIDQTKNYALSRKYSDTLIHIYKSRADNCKLIKTFIYKSYYHIQKSDYQLSLTCLNEALQLYQNKPCELEPLLPHIYLVYTGLYYHLGEDKKQASYIEKGIKSFQTKWQNKEVLIKLYELQGDLCSNLNEQLYYYHLGLKIAVNTANLKMQEHMLATLGECYAVEGQNSQAETYLKRALKLALNRKSYQSLTNIYNNLAGISANRKEVAIYLDSAIYYAQLSGDLQDYQIGRQNKAYLYYLNQDYKRGYDELWQSWELKDSLYNLNKIQAFADMEQKYESEKKNSEIKLLQNEKEIEQMKASRNLAINFGLGGALLAFIIVSFAFYQQNKKKQKLNEALSSEKKKSDDLLLNILPGEIADELKHTGSSEAKLFNHVSVLFTDFVNFTGLSEQMTPSELVQEIHKNFTAFDAIMEKHGVEKIKTIGDAYLAVCGLPNEQKDHAQKLVQAAIELQQYVLQNKGKFQIRIGINSGSVVAGIVGVKKFAYDIWGDTVNTASRMESLSEPGKINISSNTYELIKDDQQFTFISRGKLQVKGKGEMEMYFVEGKLVES